MSVARSVKMREKARHPGFPKYEKERHCRSSVDLVDAVTLLEAIDTSARIYQFLTAGIERMALGTNFDLELTLYGTALEGLAASTAHDALAIGRMDILLHSFHPS